jgi:hypothetical protein
MANLVVTNNANAAFFDIELNNMRDIKTSHKTVSLRKTNIAWIQNHEGNADQPAYLEVIMMDGTVYPLEVTTEYLARIVDPLNPPTPAGMLIDSVCAVACTNSTQTRNLILANI